MKKFCVLFALTLISNYAIAQDKVILKIGDTLTINNEEIPVKQILVLHSAF